MTDELTKQQLIGKWINPQPITHIDAGYDHAAAEMRWIPVSERLPEESDGLPFAYNVTYISEHGSGPVVVPARFGNGKFHWADVSGDPIDNEHRKVVAWKPLPPPYRAD